MSTTTIRLTKELKQRVVRAARRTGTTAHAFMLEAIAEKAELDERRAEFREEAARRSAEVLANGKTIPWSRMRSYLERRAAGKPAARPAARKLAR